MATNIEAVCSECFTSQQVELTPRRSEIRCRVCGHSVPMFERREIGGIGNILTLERRKAMIALLFFVATVFFMFLYVMFNTPGYLVEVDTGVEEVGVFTGKLVKRDDTSVSISGSEGETTYEFATTLSDRIDDIKRANPDISDQEAARRAGDRYVKVKLPKPGVTWLFVLAILCGLGTIAFSFIAAQRRVICEF